MQLEMRCLLNLNTYFNHVLELWLSTCNVLYMATTCNVLYMATGADILAVNCSSSWSEEPQNENLLVIVYSKMCMLK